jgi:hypothetical protein
MVEPTTVALGIFQVLGPILIEKVLDYLIRQSVHEGKPLNATDKKSVRRIIKTSSEGKNLTTDEVNKLVDDFVAVASKPGLIEGILNALSNFWKWATGKTDGHDMSQCQAELKKLKKELVACEKRCDKNAATDSIPKSTKKPVTVGSIAYDTFVPENLQAIVREVSNRKEKTPTTVQPSSKGANPWIRHVQDYYRQRKAEDPNYKYSQAMKDAKASYKKV